MFDFSVFGRVICCFLMFVGFVTCDSLESYVCIRDSLESCMNRCMVTHLLYFNAFIVML